MRLSKRMEALVDREAKRTGRSKGAIVEALADEALRMRLFPGIAFNGTDSERRAWVMGTGLDVWQVMQMLEDFGSSERLVADTHLSERHIRLAVAYHKAYPEEIDTAVAENRRPIEQLEEEYPFIAVSRV